MQSTDECQDNSTLIEMFPSAFRAGYSELNTLGYHVIPITPGDKKPLTALGDWTYFCDNKPSIVRLNKWATIPGCGIGICLGSDAGDGFQIVAIDIDSYDEQTVRALRGALPSSPMCKIGRKGCTLFFRAPLSIKTKQFKDSDKAVIAEILAHRRQTVCPPSLHKDTGRAYVWECGPVPVSELPILDEDDAAAFLEALEANGWNAAMDAEIAERRERRVTDEELDESDDYVFRLAARINRMALDDLGAWVPRVGFAKLERTGQGYRVLAHWRDSNKAWEDREPNVGIVSEGIKDFGIDEGMTPISLVMNATGKGFMESLLWLDDIFDATETKNFQIVRPTIPEPEPDNVPLEIPRELTTPPGLLGEMVVWIESTAPRPNRVVAFCSALSVACTLIGRRDASPQDSTPNLYITCLALTGAGKEHGRNAASKLLLAAGADALLGASEFMSQTALVNQLKNKPLSLSLIDEIGLFLARVNSKKASVHDGGIKKILLESWGINSGLYTTPAWAGDGGSTVHAPHFSILGTSTPESFYDNLAGCDIANGFLNRLLVIETHEKQKAQIVPPGARVIPAEMAQRLKELFEIQIEHSGPLARQINNVVSFGLLDWSEEIQADYLAFIDQMSEREASKVDGKFFSRVVETATRLATIQSMCRDPGARTISMEDWTWGKAVALWAAQRFAKEALSQISETEHQAMANRIFNTIKDDPGICKSDLKRNLRNRYKAKEVDQMLEELKGASRIREEAKRYYAFN